MNNMIKKALQQALEQAGTQAELARNWGMSRAFISDLFAGRREISPRVAKLLGYEMKVVYKRIETYQKIK